MRFIRRRAKCYFYAVAVLCCVSLLIFNLLHQRALPTSYPLHLERLKSPWQNTTENVNEKQLFTTEHQSRIFKHKTTLITTKTCVQQYFLLILVSSSPSNLQRRSDIRQTWGVDTALKSRWKTAFLVAQTRFKSESDSLLKEEETFGDLVQANYYDDYWNNTLKIRMGFEWAARYCKFSFLLKVDDDVFVGTKALISFLNAPSTPKEKLYMGRDGTSAVMRDGKWKISREEYSKDTYPPFSPGFGLVFSADVIDLLVDLFDVLPKFRFDDVYIGMLADKAGVKILRNNDLELRSTPENLCKWRNGTLVRHDVTGECLFRLFHETSIH